MPRRAMMGSLPCFINLGYYRATEKYNLKLSDARPGDVALSADNQAIDADMEKAGFRRMVEWLRPDNEETYLTLWRYPGLSMPNKRMGKASLSDMKCKCDPGYRPDRHFIEEGESAFSCCGAYFWNHTLSQDPYTAMISMRKTGFSRKRSIRIFEGPYEDLGNTRWWFTLPPACDEFEFFNTTLD